MQSWLQEIDPPRPGKRQRQLVSARVAGWAREELVDEAAEVHVMSEVEVLFAYLARHDRMASSAHHSETGNLTQARDKRRPLHGRDSRYPSPPQPLQRVPVGFLGQMIDRLPPDAQISERRPIRGDANPQTVGVDCVQIAIQSPVVQGTQHQPVPGIVGALESFGPQMGAV